MCLGSVGVMGSAGQDRPLGWRRAAECWSSLCDLGASFPERCVQLSNEDYFIEPLDGVPARPGHAQPHVVYKRQVPEKWAEPGDSRAPGTCGVKGVFLCYQLWGRG